MFTSGLGQEVIILFGHDLDYSRVRPDPDTTHRKVAGNLTAVYCFSATNWLVVPRSLSVIAMVMVLPSGATVIR